MKFLVTGGAGFIGSHLCDHLLSLGHAVLAVDDLSLGREVNLAQARRSGEFRFVKADLLQPESWRKTVSDFAPDAVFHMAANSDIQSGGQDPTVDLRKTFQTTVEVLEFCRLHGVKRLLFASTSAVYGEHDEALYEDMGRLLPISNYGAAKLAAESFISSYVSNYGLQAWIYRFPNVVGERSTHGAMFDFMNRLEQTPRELRILGDGEQSKPYLYVKDLIDGIWFAFQKAQEPLNIFNLGVDSETRVKEIADIVCEEMGLRDVRYQFTGGTRGWVGDVPRFKYDLGRIHQLGWRARTVSSDSLRIAARAELEERKARSGR
jgi:UDP-glucose 4-epimerase